MKESESVVTGGDILIGGGGSGGDVRNIVIIGEKPARARAKDESPMARAKVAATKLRDLDATKGKLLLAIDRYQAKVGVLDDERNEFVLTLSDDVVAILKAGGVL